MNACCRIVVKVEACFSLPAKHLDQSAQTMMTANTHQESVHAASGLATSGGTSSSGAAYPMLLPSAIHELEYHIIEALDFKLIRSSPYAMLVDACGSIHELILKRRKKRVAVDMTTEWAVTTTSETATESAEEPLLSIRVPVHGGVGDVKSETGERTPKGTPKKRMRLDASVGYEREKQAAHSTDQRSTTQEDVPRSLSVKTQRSESQPRIMTEASSDVPSTSSSPEARLLRKSWAAVNDTYIYQPCIHDKYPAHLIGVAAVYYASLESMYGRDNHPQGNRRLHVRPAAHPCWCSPCDL